MKIFEYMSTEKPNIFNKEIVNLTKTKLSKYEKIAVVKAKVNSMVTQENRFSVNELKNLEQMIDHVLFQIKYNIIDDLSITREFPNKSRDVESVPVSRLFDQMNI